MLSACTIEYTGDPDEYGYRTARCVVEYRVPQYISHTCVVLVTPLMSRKRIGELLALDDGRFSQFDLSREVHQLGDKLWKDWHPGARSYFWY